MPTIKVDISTKKYPNTFALIDAQDAEKVMAHKWCMTNSGYANRTDKQKNTIAMHRLIIGAKKGELVDHIDGNPLNNTRKNLRLATSQQNAFNTKLPKHNTSGYKGVSWHKRKQLWQACVYSNNTSKFLGFYLTKEEAAVAYNVWVVSTRKEYGKLNNVPTEVLLLDSVKARIRQLGKGQSGMPKRFRNLRKNNV